MRKLLATCLILLFVLASSTQAAARGVKKPVKKRPVSSAKPARDLVQTSTHPRYALDRLLVRFARDENGNVPTQAEEEAILASLLGGGTVTRQYWLVPGLTLVQLPSDRVVTEAMLKKLNDDPRILYAEPDYALTLCE